MTYLIFSRLVASKTPQPVRPSTISAPRTSLGVETSADDSPERASSENNSASSSESLAKAEATRDATTSALGFASRELVPRAQEPGAKTGRASPGVTMTCLSRGIARDATALGLVLRRYYRSRNHASAWFVLDRRGEVLVVLWESEDVRSFLNAMGRGYLEPDLGREILA